MHKPLFAFLITFAFVGGAIADPLHEAADAYSLEDYATAYELAKPLADAGDGDAQHLVGLMYANGQGVPQNSVEAAKWYRKAAEQGVRNAQNN